MDFTGTLKEQTFAVITIIVFSVISYGEILGYYFTDLDAFPLIKSSLVTSLDDIGRIFTEPLMGNIVGAFPSDAFYRPVTTLSYSMDYWLWGLNPAGYHLTDITLHTLTSIAVFYLVRSLLNNKPVFLALFTAVIFTIHPINMEVVPAVARRGDILATLFLVLTLISFVKYQSGYKRHSYVSAALCFLALGSKESGITILPIMFFYLMLFTFYNMELKERVVRSLTASSPYLIIGVVYICLHFYICENQEAAYPGNSYFKAFKDTIRGYLIGLFFPSLNMQLQSILGSLKEILLNRNSLLAILLSMSFLAIIILKYGDIKSKGILIKQFLTGNESPEAKVILFFLIWLVISGGLFVLGQVFTIRYLYPLAIVPSALLTLGFCCGVTYLKEINKERNPGLSARIWPILLITVFSGSFASLLYSSPLINDYNSWEESGKISKHALEETAELLADLPDNSELFLVNYPLNASVGDLRLKNLGHTRMLLFYCVQSYIDLLDPSGNKRIIGITALTDITSAKDVDITYDISNRTILARIKKGGFITEDSSHRKYKKGYFEVTESKDRKKLSIHTSNGNLNAADSYFLLYTGKNVEIVSFERLLCNGPASNCA